MCVCTRVRACTHTHTHTHTHVHQCIHVSVCVPARACMHTHTHTHTHMCINVYMSVQKIPTTGVCPDMTQEGQNSDSSVISENDYRGRHFPCLLQITQCIRHKSGVCNKPRNPSHVTALFQLPLNSCQSSKFHTIHCLALVEGYGCPYKDSTAFYTLHRQGATLTLVLLSGTSRTSIRTSKFCQLFFWQIFMLFCIIYTSSGGGQVRQSSGQVKILCYFSSGQALKILNVTPRTGLNTNTCPTYTY